MALSYTAFYKQLEKEVHASTDYHNSVEVMMQWGARQIPHADWSRLAAFDAAKELQAAKQWFRRVLKRAPCPFEVRGAFVGLGEFADWNDVEYADLYFGLMSAYDSADVKSQWLWSRPRHYPEKAYLKSKALKQGGRLCNKEATPRGLGTPGHITFSVSFAALLLRHALDGDVYRVLGGTRPIGIVTGFDSGDLIRLGELTADGFVPNKAAMV